MNDEQQDPREPSAEAMDAWLKNAEKWLDILIDRYGNNLALTLKRELARLRAENERLRMERTR